MKVEEKKREGIFEKMAMFFYRKCASGGFMGFSGKGIEADLRQLYPGESPEWLKTKYYVKKLALSLKVLAAGSLLAVGTACLAEQPVLQQETNSLQRGSPGEGEKQIELEAEYKDRKYSFSLPFSARVWPGEEAQEKLDCLEEKLPELILGKNESIDGIRENLNLFSLYEGYAPEVEWESSNPEVVTKEGEVCPGKQPEEVVLTATLTCGEYRREVVLNTVVVPEELSETEKWQRQMENYLLAKEEADRELEELELPAEWGGEVILWSQKRENRVGIVLVLTMLSAGMAYYLADRDLHGQVKNRKKKLQGEYAAFVYELVLLIQAGMTVKAAFRKLGEDYEKNRAEGGKECLVLEEVWQTNRCPAVYPSEQFSCPESETGQQKFAGKITGGSLSGRGRKASAGKKTGRRGGYKASDSHGHVAGGCHVVDYDSGIFRNRLKVKSENKKQRSQKRR